MTGDRGLPSHLSPVPWYLKPVSKTRRDPRGESQNCEVPPPTAATRETAFERPRGVGRVETRRGYCQVHVIDLPDPLVPKRLEALDAVAGQEISIDFLKLTPRGLSFVAPADRAADIESALSGCGAHAAVTTGRSIVSVHAVNIRDEEGLLAEIVQEAIALGAQIDHVGDGHDRLLLVVGDDDAARIEAHFKGKIRA